MDWISENISCPCKKKPVVTVEITTGHELETKHIWIAVDRLQIAFYYFYRYSTVRAKGDRWKQVYCKIVRNLQIILPVYFGQYDL